MRTQRTPAYATEEEHRQVERLLKYKTMIVLPVMSRSEKCPACDRLTFDAASKNCAHCSFSVEMERQIRKMQKALRSRDRTKAYEWWEEQAFLLSAMAAYSEKVDENRRTSDFWSWTD